MCEVYEQKTNACLGNPYHRISLIDFYSFSSLYENWKEKKSFLLF